jgi:hypothetical protein
MRLPTYAELLRFVTVEGWTDKDAAAGRRKGDHHRFVFTAPTGERLFTRVSHGVGQYQDPDLFRHILRDQLHIDADQFWAAVDAGVVPSRPLPAPKDPGSAIEAKLARALIRRAGVAPTDLVGLTQAEAVARWDQWLASEQ